MTAAAAAAAAGTGTATTAAASADISFNAVSSTPAHRRPPPAAACGQEHGKAVQVAPIKPTLKARGTKRLKLRYDELLSSFAFNLNLRRYDMAFQKYCNMDQSLFTRFVRLGTPYIELNAQGRARPELADLYSWRYRALGRGLHSSTSQLNLSRVCHNKTPYTPTYNPLTRAKQPLRAPPIP